MSKNRETVWYKYKHFWRRGDADGDDTPQDRGDGTGDLIWNTLTKIRTDGDYSDWAAVSFIQCAHLLQKPNRKRYPDEFLTGKEASNMFVYWWSKHILCIKDILKPQGRMSRDPFIALGTCYAWLMRRLEDETAKKIITIEFWNTTIPFHLRYDIGTMIWWRRLKEDTRGEVKKHLDYFKALGIMDTYARKYDTGFYQNTV